MKKAFLTMIIIALTSIFASSLGYSQVKFFEGTFEEGLAKAEKEKKKLMVDFYTDWCGWCKVLDKKVYTDKNVGDYLNEKAINMKINAETKEGKKLSADYKVTGFPCIIYMNSKGEELDRISGYMPPESFLTKSKSILENSNPLSELEEKYKNDPDNIELLNSIITAYIKKADIKKIEEYIKILIEKDPKDSKGYLINAEYSLAYMKAEAKFKNINNSDNVDLIIEPLGNFIDRYSTTKNEKVGEALFMIARVFDYKKNFLKASDYLALGLQYFPKRDDFFNGFAGYCLEKKINYEKAANFAQKAIDMKPNNEHYRITLIKIYIAMKDNDKAKKSLEKALKDFPKSDQIEQLKKEIKTDDTNNTDDTEAKTKAFYNGGYYMYMLFKDKDPDEEFYNKTVESVKNLYIEKYGSFVQDVYASGWYDAKNNNGNQYEKNNSK